MKYERSRSSNILEVSRFRSVDRNQGNLKSNRFVNFNRWRQSP